MRQLTWISRAEKVLFDAAGVIRFVVFVFVIVCAPGMVVGYSLAGRLGEVTGALVVPAVFGVYFAITGATGRRREKRAAHAKADEEAIRPAAKYERPQ